MHHRYDRRFFTSLPPTPHLYGFTFNGWTIQLQHYYPTGYSGDLDKLVKNRLTQCYVDFNLPVQMQGGVKVLDLSWFTGLCNALLTLHTIGPPLHNGPTFYPNFSVQTKEAIEGVRPFNSYNFQVEYCVIDTLFRTFAVKENQPLYLGLDTPFKYPIGTTLSFHYFASASKVLFQVLQQSMFGGIVLELVNTRGLPTMAHSQYPHEEEYLIYPFDEFVVQRVKNCGTYICITLVAKQPVSFKMDF